MNKLKPEGKYKKRDTWKPKIKQKTTIDNKEMLTHIWQTGPLYLIDIFGSSLSMKGSAF